MKKQKFRYQKERKKFGKQNTLNIKLTSMDFRNTLIQVMTISIYKEYGITMDKVELDKIVELVSKTELNTKQIAEFLEKHAQELVIANLDSELTSNNKA